MVRYSQCRTLLTSKQEISIPIKQEPTADAGGFCPLACPQYRFRTETEFRSPHSFLQGKDTACVLAKGGKPLMPTNIRRARQLLAAAAPPGCVRLIRLPSFSLRAGLFAIRVRQGQAGARQECGPVCVCAPVSGSGFRCSRLLRDPLKRVDIEAEKYRLGQRMLPLVAGRGSEPDFCRRKGEPPIPPVAHGCERLLAEY